MLCVAISVIAACGGSEDAEPAPTPLPSATPQDVSTGSDTPAPRDLIALAQRFRGLGDIARTDPLPPPQLGEELDVSVLTLSADPEVEPSRRTARVALRGVSEHAYFFVETDTSITDDEIEDAKRAFEEEIWPAVTEAFGLPEQPGVDGDPRIGLVHAGLGPVLGGYVSGEDAYPRAAVPQSNGREVIYVNSAVRPLGSAGYTGLVAHEFQHLVHRRLDADEESWVNEGLSQVAAGLVGVHGTFGAFLGAPDTQLTDWGLAGASAAHYAAGELFATYLLEQTGGDPGALAAEPANGVEGVRAFLAALDFSRSFEELAADWAVANELDEPEGPYGYAALEVGPPEHTPIETSGAAEGRVAQFAADYLALSADDFPSGVTLSFEGDQAVAAVAAQQDADGAFWWSGRGDNMDATLTRELDLTGAVSATLTFRTWFDAERWFDWGYVAVSRDGGTTWTALAGERTADRDPIGVAYGPGYTGISGGGEAASWVDERVDLSAYAGELVLVRFELLNDDAINRPGWAIDDIAVPEIGFLDDAESDPGGWYREGFRRVSSELTQTFELRVITFGDAPEVLPVRFGAVGNRAVIDLSGLGSAYREAIVVVMGTTAGTTEPARYRYDVTSLSP